MTFLKYGDKINMENISLHLKQSIHGNHTDTLDLSPWEIAGFLDICRQALYGYICHANMQLGADSEAHIPIIELEKIDSVFRELSNNFFPMAHSNEPLRKLQIVDKAEYQRVLQHLSQLTSMGHEVHELSKDLSQSIERLINP